MDMTRKRPFPPGDPRELQLVNGETLSTPPPAAHGTKKSETGTWRAANFLYPLSGAEFQAALSTTINLVTYLVGTMHESVSESTKITSNFTGTCYFLTVLGGFVADSYLGTYWTIAGSSVITTLGLGLLTFSAAKLRPAECTPTATSTCSPAGPREMAPLYVALYTIALGTGGVRPNMAAIGADQFDDSSPVEKEQGVRFFVWFYFYVNMGLLLCFSVCVYIQDNVSRAWGYGFSLMIYGGAVIIFLLGSHRFRLKPPSGSFLTRAAQVLVASIRKRKMALPEDTSDLYDAPLPGTNTVLQRTTNLRFLDKAAIISTIDREELQVRETPTRWRLCSVTQVEESKRIAQMLPIWATTALVSIVFSQLATFTILMGSTLDRKLGSHFTVPAASLNSITTICSLIFAPIYDAFVVPFARKYTKHPYGFSTLQRMGASITFAMLAMIIAALVEGRRLKDVRRLHLQQTPVGTFVLPMKLWWFVPQFVTSAMMEFTLFISQYQFFYHEASDGTRSIASSFTYSAASIGYYSSTVLVDLTNWATRHKSGGSWLEANINDGGLENFYWLLVIILSCDLVVFLICSHLYSYKYDWYHAELPPILGCNGESELEEPLPSPQADPARAWELRSFGNWD